MKEFERVVMSEKEPLAQNLWLYRGTLRYFGNKGWTTISSGIGKLTPEGGVILNDTERNAAKAPWSLASGESTSAFGAASAVFNENTVAYNHGESAFGRWNVSHESDDAISQTMFSVGVGDGLKARNAYEVMGNGDFYIYGLGGYDGTNAGGVGALPVQDLIPAETPAKPLDVFDASALYDAYIKPNEDERVVTEEFKNELIEAVRRNALVYIANDNGTGFSFKVVVVFAGKTERTIDFTASDHVAHYKITLDLTTNKVTLKTIAIIKSYDFNVSNTPEAKARNLEQAREIPLDKVETVRLSGTSDVTGTQYNTLGIYHAGRITSIQGNTYVTLDVNFTDGSIKLDFEAKVDKLLPYVDLKIGTDIETMEFNRENMPIGNFFIKTDYGFGVGSFQAATGGFAHMTSARGNEVFYTISPDGAVEKDTEYIKPNEPYTVQLEAELLNTPIEDSVLGSQIMHAGELIISGITGPITYTRAADSTPTIAHFTDDRKDGQMAVVSYNSSNKMLSAVTFGVPVDLATPDKVGGILQGEFIEDASETDLLDKFNALLNELKNAGVLKLSK